MKSVRTRKMVSDHGFPLNQAPALADPQGLLNLGRVLVRA